MKASELKEEMEKQANKLNKTLEDKIKREFPGMNVTCWHLEEQRDPCEMIGRRSYMKADVHIEGTRYTMMRDLADDYLCMPTKNLIPLVPLETISPTPKIKKVIFNKPATIVLWSDGTKTVVKCAVKKFDKEKGLAMAITKKFLGNKGNYYNEVRKWLEEAK